MVFCARVEEAFGLETLFQLFEGELQRALPTKVDFLDRKYDIRRAVRRR